MFEKKTELNSHSDAKYIKRCRGWGFKPQNKTVNLLLVGLF